MLDQDDYAEAPESGSLTRESAINGLRRRQRFSDRHSYAGRFPISGLCAVSVHASCSDRSFSSQATAAKKRSDQADS